MKNITQWALLIVIAAGLAGCSTALAQRADTGAPDNRRTISVSGTGSVRVKPDLAIATLGTTKSDAKLSAAKSAADSAIAAIKASLRKSGIAEEDIQTVQYQIYRVQANPQAGIRESTWKVVHLLSVRTKKPETIANVVDAAVAAGATDVQGIGFTVDQLAPHRAKARELAVKAAQDKARDLARLLGIAVGEVITVTEVGDYQPMPQMMSNVRFEMAGDAIGGSGIEGGQVEVSTTTQVVFGIR